MSSEQSLGFLETTHLSIVAVVADAMVKQSRVHLLGIEPAGTELILIRIVGESPGDVADALATGEAAARRMGVEATANLLPRPEERLALMNAEPNVISGIYGGREQLLPTDYRPNMKEKMEPNQWALGILETQGLTAILEATDTMLKAANVELVGKEKIGAAYVTVIVRGDVAAVTAAVDAGREAVGSLGKLIAAHVIARPHGDLMALLPPTPKAALGN